jgi:hypothetical protein
MVQLLGTVSDNRKSAHLLLSDTTIKVRGTLPFQSSDPPLESVTERTSTHDEVFQLLRILWSGDSSGGIDGYQVKVGDAGDVSVKLLQVFLDGGDLEWVELV